MRIKRPGRPIEDEPRDRLQAVVSRSNIQWLKKAAKLRETAPGRLLDEMIESHRSNENDK